MLQLDHHIISPEAHQEIINPNLDPDQEIETHGSENDQHRQSNNTASLKGNSTKTRYFPSWSTVYRITAAKTTSAKILNSLVKLVIVLYRNSGIQEGAGVLDLLDMSKRLMRNMQLNK